MSKVEGRLHRTDDAGGPPETSIRQGAGTHQSTLFDHFNPATITGALPATTSCIGSDLNLDKEATNLDIAQQMTPSDPHLSDAPSSSQLSLLSHRISRTNASPAYSIVSNTPPVLYEDAASLSQMLDSPVPSVTTRPTEEAYGPPPLLNGLEYRGTGNSAGTVQGQTTPLADPQGFTSHKFQDQRVPVSGMRKEGSTHSTKTLGFDEATSTLRRLRRDGLNQAPKTQKGPQIAKKGPKASAVSTSRVTKAGRRPGQQFEMQWRIGQAPRIGTIQNQEQIHYGNILSSISRYYSGNAENGWKSAPFQSTPSLDQNFETLRFMGLTITVAGLITTGRSVQAREALDQIGPAAKTMLLSHHPMTFWALLDQVMDTSQTVLGNLRAAITTNLASLAGSLLGHSHPLTILLKTPLTTEQKARLRLQAQMVIHDEMVRVFGLYSYQTFIQFGYTARTVMTSGRPEEAIRMLSGLREVLDRHYGLNSAMPTLGVIEQARYELASGSSSVMLECMLGDALRRNHILYTGSGDGQDQSLDIGENALRDDYLIVMRVVILRLLGRVHVRRRSFGAAIYHFDQAVAAARPLLIPESNTMRMCAADLEMAKELEAEKATGILGGEDPYDRFASPFSITQWIPIEDRVVRAADSGHVTNVTVPGGYR